MKPATAVVKFEKASRHPILYNHLLKADYSRSHKKCSGLK
jgi:hypothetical protein